MFRTTLDLVICGVYAQVRGELEIGAFQWPSMVLDVGAFIIAAGTYARS